MPQITIGDIEIDIIRKKIKNLYLAISAVTGKVSIKAPMKMSPDSIQRFILAKLSWIKKHKLKWVKQERPLPCHYLTGEHHYFLGNLYRLNVMEVDARSKVVIRDHIYLDLSVKNAGNIEQRRRALNAWYRKQLKAQLIPIVEKWQTIMGVQAKDFRIKQMKTRWGTCNIKTRRIWINLELAKKSISCLEYIVVHELVHLFERYHNKRFYAYMDKFMPQWRMYRDELKLSL